jgi:hypothetical protein
MMMTVSVNSWWTFLCVVAAINVTAWSVSAVMLYRRQALLTPDAFRLLRLQLILSAGYVAGCAFRSVVPVYDVPRIVMLDSWMSSVFVGRSIATVAELCFVAQWAVLLNAISRTSGSALGRAVAMMLVPSIVIAEVCSWYSVLTTSNIGHVIEESIWGCCAALVVASLVVILPRCTGALRRLLNICCVAGIAYVAYMFLVDVPMYWTRWIADEAHGRQYLSIGQGLIDVSSRWRVSHRWEDWQHEVAWMSLYFSVAVWLSIALVHAPVSLTRRLTSRGDRLSSTVGVIR